MTKILTVDDSRAIRSMVGRELRQIGLEVEEAADGEQGLARLAEGRYDLVLLDVTMPVVGGPEMLDRLRARGDHTPVLMLTSESSQGVVESVTRLGIAGYLLKPFRGEELRPKVLEVLGLAGHPPIDVLVVDDLESTHRRLRSLIPEQVGVEAAATAAAALAVCRERDCRIILVDTELPEIAVPGLVAELRALRPGVTILGVCLRTTNDVESEVRALGFDGALTKPFDEAGVKELVLARLGAAG